MQAQEHVKPVTQQVPEKRKESKKAEIANEDIDEEEILNEIGDFLLEDDAFWLT